MTSMDERYEVLDVVASGASSTVWRARDRHLDRLVAIKRPHPGEEGAARFAAAARSAASVSHPHLVTIFDTGVDASGPYVVMEFVDGPTLAEMGTESGRAPALGSDVASGLSALHAAGIVHGDVRPSNIILAPTGTRLTAFAAARPRDTSSQSVMPTPRFVAPEILAGDEPSAASDVYSLGAVLSWLTGEAPADEGLSAAIMQATSDVPAARPTAATLASRLDAIAAPRLAAVATTTPGVEGSPVDPTREFDTASMVEDPDVGRSIPDDADANPPERRRTVVMLSIAVLVALIAWVAVALSGDDDSPVPAAGDTTTVDPAPTTAPETTQAGPETTVAEEQGGVFATVRIFVEFIRDTPRNVLDATGAEDIVSDVADGVSQAIRGNEEEAESRFADAVETVEEEIDSPTVVDRAIELIGRIAQQLGLNTEGFLQPSE